MYCHTSHPDPRPSLPPWLPQKQLLLLSSLRNPLSLLIPGEPSCLARQAAPSQHICRQPDEPDEVCGVDLIFLKKFLICFLFFVDFFFVVVLGVFFGRVYFFFNFSTVCKKYSSAKQSLRVFRALETTLRKRLPYNKLHFNKAKSFRSLLSQ